ncbi:centrosomal protein of 112 kDa isoform X1 [Carcharodon carcharias]|uniref:centrosomal protein of 112 kDa isoform X1 n=1 Tax=Carcharodon carcharias TaxID=13397 RepID=UPI001B7F258A|nr:centrosomal protein of 112 kDa isoform X1 [Carcharodon carcharias]XP_041072481.1 centrosomal protein of 112 kDa isoform X1 [Carcharodon carcharias]XP_041072482.1 centrosomal protein of 112 kDa isoform X1 [Carcharodon carcharias]
MSNKEETWEKLDSEFDHYLVDMKPYVLKLLHKSERQRCALWIKKLCDPSGAGAGVMGRKNRNMYAKLLLHMLRRGVLEGPFTHRPEPGSLKTLPSYMSIYFDEPSFTKSPDHQAEGIPDWVTGELGAGDSKSSSSWKSCSKDDSSYDSPRAAHRRRHTYNGKVVSEPRPVASSDESDVEAKLNSWNLGIENPRYLREKPIPLSPILPKASLGNVSTFGNERTLVRMHEKEIEMKTKMLEAKFHEEKLKLQQKHDTDVQKILDRKNNEIEELKTLYRNKQKEAEEITKKLEKRVQSLVRESQVIRESKENQIVELKKMAEQSADSLKNDWERKLHNVVAELEQEKFELQKKHTENIQELLNDTNSRLSKMETEYAAQTKATNQMVKELEARVQQLTVEAENSTLVRQKLTQEKGELEHRCQMICLELQEVKLRYSSLQKEKQQILEGHEKTVRQMQNQHDSELNYVKQEHAHSAAKAADVIEELEQNISQLKKELQESEHQKQQQLRNEAGRFEREKLHLEHLHEKKIHAFQTERDQEKTDAVKQIRKLEEAFREKEDQLTRVAEMQKLQAQKADAALEEFKRQVELNSEKVYSEMKQQMEKVEADLSRSKSVREKQSKEFSWQLEELKQRYEQQIVELKLEHEQEKTHLFQQHNAEKDSLVREHEREIDNLEKQLRAAIVEHESQTQEWRRRDSQTIAELESQVHQLREELIQVNSRRKQQLVELGLLREEEKQKALRDHEATVNKLKAEMERMKLELQKTNAAEIEHAVEKTSNKLKQIEKEYSQRLLKSSQTVAELQTTITSLREENSRQQLATERQLQEAVGRFENEKRLLIRDNDRGIKTLENEAENYRSQIQALEKEIQNKELETQEQITHIQQEYEMKIKGLMPATVRQELEDTISSMKSQVTFLQKRASVLQEELNTYRNRR